MQLLKDSLLSERCPDSPVFTQAQTRDRSPASCFAANLSPALSIPDSQQQLVKAHLAIKKAESQRMDGFKLWCWKRLLRVPWTARQSNQSILKEINPECSLAGLMLKLKLQYFSHLMQRDNSLEKTLMLGKIEGKRRRG